MKGETVRSDTEMIDLRYSAASREICLEQLSLEKRLEETKVSVMPVVLHAEGLLAFCEDELN